MRPVSWSALLAALIQLACGASNIDVLTAVDQTAVPQHTTTRLIHWGSGQPTGLDDLTWLVGHLSEVEATPFDGTVLDLGIGTSWLGADFSEATLSASSDLLKNAPFTTFTDNFQKLEIGSLDFSDDNQWSLLAQNLPVLAASVKQAGLRGFMLDTQEYSGYAWSYASRPGLSETFDSASQRFFLRGRDFLQAVLTSYPDVVVMDTLSTSDVFREVCLSGTSLESSKYALLPAFLDGMRAASDEARTGATLIDGFLPAYAARDPASFRLYYDLIHGDWQALQSHWFSGVVTYRFATMESDQTLGEVRWPDRPALQCTAAEQQVLTRDFLASFGVMLDYPKTKTGNAAFETDSARFGLNAHDPEEYGSLLQSALETSDRYVWSWTSSVVWWQLPGRTEPLVPSQYVQAARLAYAQSYRLE